MVEKDQFINFEVNKVCYGARILQVDEIVPLVELNPIPKAPEIIEGVMNLRGMVIPVVDLRKQFSEEAGINTVETRILIANMSDKKCGFIVDRVIDIQTFASDNISDPVLDSEATHFISGIAKTESNEVVQLIEFAKLLDPQELSELTQLNPESHDA